MNEVSIIINGVRYDRQVADNVDKCKECDLWDFCARWDFCAENPQMDALSCAVLIGHGTNFKLSTKSFER